MDRRQFLFSTCAAGVAGMAFSPPVSAEANRNPDAYGVLVDTTECIGCRKCEYACAKSNKLNDLPLEAFEDKTACDAPRRMTDDAYTVVNCFPDPAKPDKPTYVKSQCMHCLEPACVSACLVGALGKRESGAVTYDSWKCMGCRYCMIACPFQVPAYEYDNALTPVVSKCTFCFERTAGGGESPACVGICPPMCLTYAKRSELIVLAHAKIKEHPGRYLDHVYGETELGGTSWLYLTSRPVTELGLLEFGEKPIPDYTEPLQHGIFKHGAPPAFLFGLLAVASRVFHHKEAE